MSTTHANPVRGILFMVVTGLCFVGVTVTVKILGGRVPAAESAFLRYFFGLVFLIPAWNQLRALRMTRRQWSLSAVRGAAQTLGVICWFFAMSRIPLAEVTAMNYLTPIYVTVLAVFVLRERLAMRRILAIVAALGGALLILRPGFRELDPGHFAMLGTSLMFAISYLIAKIITDELSPAIALALLSISVTLGLLPFALAVWVWPSWGDVAILMTTAAFATAGHYAMVLAFASAPVTVTQPVTFLQLVWSVAIGALFFAEPVDPFVVGGGLVIIGSVLFITLREAMLKRRVTPSGPETKF
ncbi:DMT family transporter [Salipiger sp. H15]|uniref:DMT family transporter n=1 Tax=Alloyangia sp. H15 TaxID=3029062 RepID=A0AAU8AFK9_9RHOB